MKKILQFVVMLSMVILLSGCDESSSRDDVVATKEIGDKLVENQPTPTDIDYSLERYNLIKRAYWVNGMREKALGLPCPIADVPLGYVVLFTESGDVVGQFTIDGKVTSLNSYLTPDSEYYSTELTYNRWVADIDGSYGSNDADGIFFFTTDGKYVEWTGTYIYSDIPFNVESTVLK